MSQLPSYVLVTPARNEESFIELTLRSVVNQTCRPLKWVIVSDGSTDRTDQIVGRYAAERPWIELLRMPPRQERHFAGKVNAFNAGYEKLRGLAFEVIGSLDADISFEADYFAFLLRKFVEWPELGVAGTPFCEAGRQYDYRFTSIEHVSGACQLFRRRCFEDIGGYTPIRIGGVDLVAVTTARMKGWQTRSFTEQQCEHHRLMGTARQSALMVAFKGGRGDYLLGGHPVWEVFRGVYQTTRPPYVLGGLLRLAGFYWALVTGTPKAVSPEFVAFRRKEQMRRLAAFFSAARQHPLSLW